MLILLGAYLYKFQLKPRWSKLSSFLHRPHFVMALQPVKNSEPVVQVLKARTAGN
jgi:hypothetical protein